MVDYKIEILDHDQIKRMLPDIGPDVVGGSYLSARRPCEFAAPVPRPAQGDQRARRRPTCRATRSRPSRARAASFSSSTPRGAIRAGKVALAAGNANMRLAPMVGLDCADAARARPDRRYRAAAAVPRSSGRDPAPDRRGHGHDRRLQGREHRSVGPHHRRQRHRGRRARCGCFRC